MKNRGSISIEISLFFFLVAGAVMLMIVSLVLSYEKEELRGDIYRNVYSIPYAYVREDSETSYLKNLDLSGGHAYGSVETKEGKSGGVVSLTGILNYQGANAVQGGKESGLLSGRLRRWQLYDHLTEK